MKISDKIAEELELPDGYRDLDIAVALYKKGFQIPDITPSPFGLSVFRKNLESQLVLFEESQKSQL